MVFGRDFLLPETIAILDRAILGGFTLPSESTIFAMDRLIGGMINNGIWNSLDCFGNGAYNDLACQNFSRINWRHPAGANLFTLQADIVYQTTGWKANGTLNGYIDTNHDIDIPVGVTPRRYNLNDIHYMAVVNNVSDVSVLNDAVIASVQSNMLEIIHAANTNQQRVQTAVNLDTTADMSGTGMKYFGRNSSTNVELYNGATSLTRTAATTGTLVSISWWIFRNTTTRFSKLGISCFSLGGDFNGDATTFRTLYNQYLTEIGLTPIA